MKLFGQNGKLVKAVTCLMLSSAVVTSSFGQVSAGELEKTHSTPGLEVGKSVSEDVQLRTTVADKESGLPHSRSKRAWGLITCEVEVPCGPGWKNKCKMCMKLNRSGEE